MLKNIVLFVFGFLLFASSSFAGLPTGKSTLEKVDTRYVAFQCFRLDPRDGYTLVGYDAAGNLITKPISEHLSHKACFWAKDGLNRFAAKHPVSEGQEYVLTCKHDADGTTRLYGVPPKDAKFQAETEKVLTVFGNSNPNRWDRCEELALGIMETYRAAPTMFDDFFGTF